MTVNDKRVALIKNYAEKFGSLTDAYAKNMIDQSLDFESSRATEEEIRKRIFESRSCTFDSCEVSSVGASPGSAG